jgi:hypothetical protein
MKGKTLGYKRSEETKIKIGKASKGRLLGRKQSPEHIKRRIGRNRNSSKSERLWGKKVEETFGVVLLSFVWLEGKCYGYGKYLFEIDCKYWHSSENAIKRDIEKNEIAKRQGYILLRFDVNTISEVEKAIKRDFNKLKEIFSNG